MAGLYIVTSLAILQVGTAVSFSCEQDPDHIVSYRNRSLEEIPSDIPINVRHLDLTLNRISRLPAGRFFARFPNLTTLDMSWNILSSIDSRSFADMTSLECLDMTGNNISTIAIDTFTGSDKIKSILLAGNDLTVWDFTTITDMSATLSHLDLSENEIKNVDCKNNEDASFPFLKVLKINRNKIGKLENISLPLLPSIRELHLNDNFISSIPVKFFANMSTLQKLDLSGNKIVYLTNESCFGLEALLHLNLDFNDMESVPSKCLLMMANLESISLNGNTFETIPSDSFQGLAALSRLEISNCYFLQSVQPNAFAKLTNLKELRMTNNKILAAVNPNIWGNTSMILETLVLDSNELLRTLSRDLLRSLPRLGEFFLQNLDLRCDCDLRWIKDGWLSAVYFYLDNTTCADHPSMNRTLLTQVKSEEMVCETPVVVTSSVDRELPDMAQMQITITNIGLPVVTWTLPTGVTLSTEEYRPSENSSTFIITETSIVSSVLVCSLNISNVTDEFYGQYLMTATNLAGNISQSLFLSPISRDMQMDPALLLQIQLTVALVCMVAVVILVGMVCFINTHHSNSREVENQSLLAPNGSKNAEKRRDVHETDSFSSNSDNDSKSTLAGRADVESSKAAENLPIIPKERIVVLESRDNVAYQSDSEEFTKL